MKDDSTSGHSPRDVGGVAAAACTGKAESLMPGFTSQAKEIILLRLASGAASCEVLTDAVIEKGIKPHDQRAFGAVFASLSRAGSIVQVGWCFRSKGHGAPGGRVWALP